jgi:HSP20 family protein
MAWTDLIPWRRGQIELPARPEEERPFFSLQHWMNSLFESMFADFDRHWKGFGGALVPGFGPGVPDLGLEQDENGYRLKVELPGFEEKDLEVQLAGNELTIRAKKEALREEKEGGVSGRAFSSFQHTLAVPPGIDRDKVGAELKNGVLTLTLPKTEEAKKSFRRIEIQSHN